VVKFYGSWKKQEELFVRILIVSNLVSSCLCFVKIAMELCGGGAGNDLYQVLDRPVPENVIAYVTRESLRVCFLVVPHFQLL
jgi:hypothetical protein